MKDNIFSFLPIEAAMDGRLTLIELRVLVALYSFRAKNTDTVWPSRAKISERTPQYCNKTISTALTGLVEKGWVHRRQFRGPSHYKLTCPEHLLETVTDPVTVTSSVTVTDPGINSYRSGDYTVTDPVTPEHTNNLPKNIYRHENQNSAPESPKATGKVNGRKRHRKFVPPTLEEVKKYVADEKLNVDPVEFFKGYDHGDWEDTKGNPVRNWKLKIRYWHKTSRKTKEQSQPETPSYVGGIMIGGSGVKNGNR
jgi:hypothetical protein